jgi:hypothetical protein
LKYAYTPSRIRETRSGPRFRVGRLIDTAGPKARDVTHLIDRTYDYASTRELRWHLAERFGIEPSSLVLERRLAAAA